MHSESVPSSRLTYAGEAPATFDRNHARTLGAYYVLTLIGVWVNTAGFLKAITYIGPLTKAFAVATYITYAFVYSLPVLALVLLWDAGISAASMDRFVARKPRLRLAIIYGFAVVAFGLLQTLIFADRTIYTLYDFHLNGFVWNLVLTPGGIDSMGGTTSATVTYTFIILGILAVQALLLLLVIRWRRLHVFMRPLLRARSLIVAGILLVLTGAFEQITYGVCHIRGYSPVLTASKAFPLYWPMTFTRLAKSMGVKVKREPSFNANVGSIRLQYPLKPIQVQPVAHPYNIVWLVSESLRFDMLDKEIMPKTWDFSERSIRCRNHYSGGNGTRMAVFSMFYGLYGTYWFPFLDEHRGPVLIDRLLELNYQIEAFTSAKFSYPEFDRTIWAKVGSEHLHEGTAQPKWRRDRENVDEILKFMENRDATRPFMTFMFFESPHATYYFPKENIIRTPYAEDINYATMDLKKDIGLIKNRYINACNHLDSQIARLLAYLEAQKLLDNTIVIITGDHGEEFMETGRWGHNSTFVEWQTRPPMVLWVPGQSPREITGLTSHLDIPATLMPLLGVSNAAQDYSQGYDLLAPQKRDHAVICDWNQLAYVDERYKAVFPVGSNSLGELKVTTRDDAPVADRQAFFTSERERINAVMKGLTRFSR